MKEGHVGRRMPSESALLFARALWYYAWGKELELKGAGFDRRFLG